MTGLMGVPLWCVLLQEAKRAVAVALRNRWRRHNLPSELAEEVGLLQSFLAARSRQELN
jgi:hypothetical protein